MNKAFHKSKLANPLRSNQQNFFEVEKTPRSYNKSLNRPLKKLISYGSKINSKIELVNNSYHSYFGYDQVVKSNRDSTIELNI